jgi:hypothetical protein
MFQPNVTGIEYEDVVSFVESTGVTICAKGKCYALTNDGHPPLGSKHIPPVQLVRLPSSTSRAILRVPDDEMNVSEDGMYNETTGALTKSSNMVLVSRLAQEAEELTGALQGCPDLLDKGRCPNVSTMTVAQSSPTAAAIKDYVVPDLTGHISRSGKEPLARGGYSVVWKGIWRPQDATGEHTVSNSKGVMLAG